MKPYPKKPITKSAGRVAQGVGPEFKPQYHKNNNKNQNQEHKYQGLGLAQWQVSESVSGKCKALRSIPRTEKQDKPKNSQRNPYLIICFLFF
jgi:hypothetical protein